MRKMFPVVFLSVIVALGATFLLDAQQSPNSCPGMSGGKGMHGKRMHGKGMHGQGMHASDPAHQADMELFHFLLDNRQSIRRTVTKTADGVASITESDDPKIAEGIRTHVAAMEKRIVGNAPIHMRDPLFSEIFKNADKITMKLEPTEKGLKVSETSKDPYVVTLIHAHADVIDAFVKNGREEAMKNHAVPKAK